MVNSNRNGHGRQTGTINPVLRPLAWSALLTATAAAAFAMPSFATPAYAEPPRPDTIPDVGARPIPAGALQLPGVGPTTVQPAAPTPSLANGPLAAAADAKELEVATLGDQLLQVRQEQQAATGNLAAAEARLQTASEALAQAQAAADAMAATALKDAAALPPGIYGTDLHGLSDLSLIGRGHGPGSDLTTEHDLARAKAARDAASEEVRALLATKTEVDGRFTQLQAKHSLAEASLLKLRRDNAAQLALIDSQQEAYEQRLGANFVGRGERSGMMAHQNAITAVRYALAQLGDPYLWAAEGPDYFDCSGLMWAAYRAAGFQLQRVAKDQFWQTRGRLVSRYDLLPGDLIFFAPPGSSWTSIHHVGMYIGDGRMVHAPRTGDVVKISTVRWSRFYAATRIFGEVPVPGLPPITAPPPIVTPPTTPTTPTPPPTTPTPPPTGNPTPPPTGNPTPPPTGNPTPPPTGNPTPPPTGTPTSPPASPRPTTPRKPPPTGTPTPEPTGSAASPETTTSTPPASEPAPESTAATEPGTAPSAPVSPLVPTGGS